MRRFSRQEARTDDNQQEIMDALRKVGALVWFIGYPLDLLVAFRGKVDVLEVKMPGEKLSQAQEVIFALMEACGYKPHKVESVDDALQAIGAVDPEVDIQ